MAALGKLNTMQPLQPSPSFDGNVSSIDYVMNLVDDITNDLSNFNFGHLLIMNLSSLVNCLVHHGQQVESVCKDQLDRAFFVMRKSAYDERIVVFARKQILHLIELRGRNWVPDEALTRYYKTETNDSTQIDSPRAQMPMVLPLPLVTAPPAPPLLAPGETIKTSGRFATPTKIPGKPYYKDEVVIRNSDSGKVMGIKGRRVHMIEELSETVISFQRVNPGARERLVQVTGPDEAHIDYARQLIGQTITRNASPVAFRDQSELDRIGGSSSSVNSSTSDESTRPQGYPHSKLRHSLSTNDASVGDYKYTVNVGANSVKITGSDHSLVMKSKLALDKFFESAPQEFDSGEFFTGYDDECPSPTLVSDEHFEAAPQAEREVGPQVPVAVAPAVWEQSTSAPVPVAVPTPHYSRAMLCMLSQSPICNQVPADWESVCPQALRKVVERRSSAHYYSVHEKRASAVCPDTERVHAKEQEEVHYEMEKEKVHEKEEEGAMRWTPPLREATPICLNAPINRKVFSEELPVSPRAVTPCEATEFTLNRFSGAGDSVLLVGGKTSPNGMFAEEPHLPPRAVTPCEATKLTLDRRFTCIKDSVTSVSGNSTVNLVGEATDVTLNRRFSNADEPRPPARSVTPSVAAEALQVTFKARLHHSDDLNSHAKFEPIQDTLSRQLSRDTPSPDIVSAGYVSPFAHIAAHKPAQRYSPLTPSPELVASTFTHVSTRQSNVRCSPLTPSPDFDPKVEPLEHDPTTAHNLDPTTMPFRPRFAYSKSCVAMVAPESKAAVFARASSVPSAMVPKCGLPEASVSLHKNTVAATVGSINRFSAGLPTQVSAPKVPVAGLACEVEVPHSPVPETKKEYATNISFRPKITNPRLAFLTPNKN